MSSLLRIPVRFSDLWRFRAPLSPDEVRRTERYLATARVSLAIAAVFTVWMQPVRVVYSPWMYMLLLLYVVHAVVVMLLLRLRPRSTRNFRLVVHSADIVWPVLFSTFASMQRGPFFLFFVFVMLAAAYRWGLWETVGTGLAAAALLWIQSLSMHLGLGSAIDTWMRHAHLPTPGVAMQELDREALFMSSFYLLVLGLLLGYMAENQKKVRAERAVITRMLSSTRVESGLTGTMQQVFSELLGIYGAHRVMTASQEANSYHVFLAEVTRSADENVLRWREALPDTQKTYLFDSSVNAVYCAKMGGTFQSVALDRAGDRLRDPDLAFLKSLSEIESFNTVASVSFVFGREWAGRLFVLDPEVMGRPEDELRFLQEFAQQVGPAIYNVYLLRRLRERAGAAERARFARELHDGAIQSLIAVEMQLDVLRRQSGTQSPVVNAELARIQKLLREEVLKLRELMQTMKSFGVDADRLVGFLSDTVERFRRETGISAEFVSELDKIELPQKVCRELARILQESLVNVRKHSGARNVLVRLAKRGGNLLLTVEDDGRGFAFSGRLTDSELDVSGKGPGVIRERVRLLAGELAIESNPGHGARLEVRIPPSLKTAKHG